MLCSLKKQPRFLTAETRPVSTSCSFSENNGFSVLSRTKLSGSVILSGLPASAMILSRFVSTAQCASDNKNEHTAFSGLVLHPKHKKQKLTNAPIMRLSTLINPPCDRIQETPIGGVKSFYNPPFFGSYQRFLEQPSSSLRNYTTSTHKIKARHSHLELYSRIIYLLNQLIRP